MRIQGSEHAGKCSYAASARVSSERPGSSVHNNVWNLTQMLISERLRKGSNARKSGSVTQQCTIDNIFGLAYMGRSYPCALRGHCPQKARWRKKKNSRICKYCTPARRHYVHGLFDRRKSPVRIENDTSPRMFTPWVRQRHKEIKRLTAVQSPQTKAMNPTGIQFLCCAEKAYSCADVKRRRASDFRRSREAR